MRLSKLDRYGLDCYAYAMLADGCIDAVIEFGLQEYDIRAPEAIVLSAGGIISNFDGSWPSDNYPKRQIPMYRQKII